MAPRFAFRASKFRNIECKPVGHDTSYEQLHVTTAAMEGNVVASTDDRFAFAHQIDGGAAIQVKALSDTGKETAAIPPLLRGHQARVNALAFSPFHANVLFSASADATVKVWQLPTDASSCSNEPTGTAVTTLRVTAATAAAQSSIVGVAHHPSASGIISAVSHKETLVFDLTTESVAFELRLEAASDDVLSSLTWNYDGSLLLTSSLNQQVRMWDPRSSGLASEFTAHTGRRRATSVVWCGRQDLLLTTGCDPMQERELKLWDPRQLERPLHRERLDASIGQLFPLYDADVDLLYVLGKGDRSGRVFEVDTTGCHKLSQVMLPHMTLGATLVRKQACHTSECEIARVLNLSANGSGGSGVCDVLSFSVPRKNALSEFQRDLYPDTLALTAAQTGEQWMRGENAVPAREVVTPTTTTAHHHHHEPSVAANLSVFGHASGLPPPPPPPSMTPSMEAAAIPASSAWGQVTSSPWAAAATMPTNGSSSIQKPSSSVAVSGWASKTTAWNAATPSAATAAATATAAQPVQWFTPQLAADEQQQESQNTSAANDDSSSSSGSTPDKMARFTTTQGHKFKYIKGKQGTRNDVLHLGDKAAASSCVQANDTYMAIPLMGAGGPVLVSPLEATGRVTPHDALVLNGQKATVGDVAFHPFNSHLLATGSGDSTIAIWNVHCNGDDDLDRQPLLELRGHTRGVRTVEFHPRASDVLCSTSQDLSIRLWDIEAGAERVCLVGKLDEPVWNATFSPDGSLLATSSRARIVRVFDPRDHDHALLAMGCGFDSIRPQYVTWLSTSTLLTLGTTGAPRHETQLRIWDARNLLDPVSVTPLDSACAESVPFYDPSSRVLFLVGLGGRHIWSYEIADADLPAVVAHANLPFIADGQSPISGAALLPKKLCDVRHVEIDKLLLLRSNTLERVSFSLPRNDKLKLFFQDDVYGQVPTQVPSLSADAWFAGDQVVVQYESLRPEDMVPLSEKPHETDKQVPMSQLFRAKWEQEERDKQLKADNLERLQALAAQPSLHAQHQRPPAAPNGGDGSDDEWDD